MTSISEIQGSGDRSPLEGQTVRTSGIVTALDSNGFYIQDPQGDGNDATSDGIFVFSGQTPSVSLGDEVAVGGTVSDFLPGSADPGSLPTTEIGGSVSVEVLSANNDLPGATIIGAEGRLPPTEDLAAGVGFFESLEGMRVTVNDPLAVGPTNGFGEIFTVADGGAAATGLTADGNLLLAPGEASFGDTNTAGGDFNPERIQIDPGLGVDSPQVDVGARLGDVTGVVGYSFGNYEVLATEPYAATAPSQLVRETTALGGDADHLLVASYNAENLDPYDGVERFATIADEILGNLNAPDVVALQEVQDNNGPTDDGVTSAGGTLQLLVDTINEQAGADGPHYGFIDNPFIGNDTNGGEPGGNIRTAFLYRDDRVSFVDGSLQTIAADGSALAQPDTDQQTNPDNPFFASRPPLAATFLFNGEDVTVVDNHFTSKGGSAPLLGADQPPFDAGEVQRAAQAQAVNDFVDSLLAGNPQAKVVVAGDLNEFPFEEPLQVVEGTASISGYDVPSDDPIEATATFNQGGGRVLEDLQDSLPADERYDYVFEGNSETLDHILASGGLADGAQFDVVHINAEFADQTSDHDPLAALFEIPRAGAGPVPTLVSLAPADGAANVASGADIVLTFDQEVRPGTGSITIGNGDGDVRTIAVDDPQVTFEGNRVVVNPAADLVPGSQYRVLIGDGAIVNGEGAAFAGLSEDQLDFSTEAGMATDPLRIVLTNDDGYDAPGIQTLYSALVDAGFDVTIVAPQVNQSAQGSSLGGLVGLQTPINVVEFDDAGNYYVDGRPAVASAVALEQIFDGEQPDLVISGTNRGENIGPSENISGTVNAAVQALFEGVPAIAVSAGSANGSYDAAFANAATFTVDLVNKLAAEQGDGEPLLPAGEGLSVNVPGASTLEGVAVTTITPEASSFFPIAETATPGVFSSGFVPNTDPSGNPTSEGSQFLEGRITVSGIDGNWGATEADRAGIETRLGDALTTENAGPHDPLNILLFNAEGSGAPGLQVALEDLTAAGYDVTVVAPASDQTGVGSALTLGTFTITEYAAGYQVGATPATTVNAALDALLTGDDRPDLIVGGIGDGPAVGVEGINHSALVGGSVYGLFNYEIPTITVSAGDSGDGFVEAATYATAGEFLTELVGDLQTTSMDGTLLGSGLGLNVNVPEGASLSDYAFTLPDAATLAYTTEPIGETGDYQLVPTDTTDGSVDANSEGVAYADGSITISPIDANFATDDPELNALLGDLLDAPFGSPSDGYAVAANEQGGNDIEVVVPAALTRAAGTADIDTASYDGSGAIVLPGNVENGTLGGEGNSDLAGNALNNVLLGNSGNNVLDGGDGIDVLTGGAGNDTLNGGRNVDTLDGGEGDDILNGGGRNDALTGSAGDDTLDGGSGNDLLTGGAGSDLFSFVPKFGFDQVEDFNVAEDRMQFSASLFQDFDALTAASRQSGDDVVIDASDGGHVVVANVELNSFEENRFLFA